MRKKLRPKLTYANVISSLCLFALLGGGAYASQHYVITSKDQVHQSVVAQLAAKGTTGNPQAAAAGKARRGPRGPRGPQGPRGLQGPPGTAPACQGNDAGDVMVKAGSICIDRFEASVWSSPTGGTQYGVSSDNYPCTDDGQNCTGPNAIYARSVAGVKPSAFITYFQAQQALANSGKRLPTNAEWQQAVAGTPDSTACNVSIGSAQNTGANASCISNHGANDMVGNVDEWVADWVPSSTSCPGWDTFSDDFMCVSGASATAFGPGAVVRGGGYNDGTDAGPFAISANDLPTASAALIGFRGAR